MEREREMGRKKTKRDWCMGKVCEVLMYDVSAWRLEVEETEGLLEHIGKKNGGICICGLANPTSHLAGVQSVSIEAYNHRLLPATLASKLALITDS